MRKYYISTSLCRKNTNSNCLKLFVNNIQSRATIVALVPWRNFFFICSQGLTLDAHIFHYILVSTAQEMRQDMVQSKNWRIHKSTETTVNGIYNIWQNLGQKKHIETQWDILGDKRWLQQKIEIQNSNIEKIKWKNQTKLKTPSSGHDNKNSRTNS